MKKEKLLISSCFLGNLVKYNGSHNSLDKNILEQLHNRYILYPVCPEVDGGLPVPRIPCEIISNTPLKILNKDGENKTSEFLLGAQKTLQTCKKENIKLALLKANSPSCSNKYVSDGTFRKKRIPGLGVSAKLLQDNGILLFNEDEVKKLIS